MDTINAIRNGKAYISDSMPTLTFSSFRPYFRVSHHFVARRLLLILFPYDTGQWTLFTPDLYIPTTALYTYLILRAMIARDNVAFTRSMTRIAVCEAVLAMLTRACTFFLDIDVAHVPLIIISLYKYVVMCVLAVSSCAGSVMRAVVCVYVMLALFVFLCRAMRSVIGSCGVCKKSVYFLVCMVLVQCLYVLIV